MASLNKVILIGNLGRDPETRYLPNGDAVPTSRSPPPTRGRTRTAKKQEKTEWHRVSLYRRLAEIAGEYLKKGSQVYIEGRIEYREYEKDGQKRYTTDIVASEMKMLGSRQGAGEASDRESSLGQRAAAALEWRRRRERWRQQRRQCRSREEEGRRLRRRYSVLIEN